MIKLQKTTLPSDASYLASLEAIILAAFFWYAAWSVQTLIAVYFHLPFHYLKYAAALATLWTIALVYFLWLKHRSVSEEKVSTINELKIILPSTFVIATTLVIISIGSAIFIKTGLAVVFIGLVFISLAVAFFPTQTLERSTRELPLRPVAVLIGGLLTVIIFYLFAHRFDTDDANLINQAVGARRFDEVLQFDTMLGPGSGPLVLPTYKAESFELLVATLADLFELPTILAAHIVVPLIFAILFVVAIARVGYDAFRNDWIGALLLLLALQLFAGTTLAGWGIHGLARFFEGKAEFVTIAVPLLAFYAYRALRDGRPFDFLMIALLEISSVGLTANALYGAPLTVGVVSVSAAITLGLDRRTLARVMIANAPSLYPLLIGVALILTGNAFPSENGFSPVGDVFRFTVGPDFAGFSLVAALALGWVVARGLPSGRFWLAYTLVATVLLVNPLFSQMYGKITGNLGNRIFWTVPALHLVAGAILIILMQLFPAKPWLRVVLCLCMLLSAALWNERLPDLVRVSWRWPGLKVDPANFQRAQEIIALTQPGCGVFLPTSVAAWVTTIDGHPYPVAVRPDYNLFFRNTRPASEIDYRDRLLDLANGKAETLHTGDTAIARDRFHIGTVASFRTNRNFQQLSDFAESLHLLRQPRTDDFAIWTGPCR